MSRQNERTNLAEANIRTIFTAINQHQATIVAAKPMQKYTKTAGRLSVWLEPTISKDLLVCLACGTLTAWSS